MKAAWSPFEQTKWMKPLLVELSSWRSTLKQIRSINYESNNATDIVFVADFPGLSLENYIAPEIRANVTVLQGQVIVEKMEGVRENITLSTNDTLTLDSDATHVIHTVTENPSCYMYVYYNTSWIEQTDEEIIASNPGRLLRLLLTYLDAVILYQLSWEGLVGGALLHMNVYYRTRIFVLIYLFPGLTMRTCRITVSLLNADEAILGK